MNIWQVYRGFCENECVLHVCDVCPVRAFVGYVDSCASECDEMIAYELTTDDELNRLCEKSLFPTDDYLGVKKFCIMYDDTKRRYFYTLECAKRYAYLLRKDGYETEIYELDEKWEPVEEEEEE